MPDEPRRDLQLKGKQLVFVFMSATAVAVVIFLCGVMVGRGIEGNLYAGSRVGHIDPTVVVPSRPRGVTRLAGALPPSSQEVLTYPGRLEAPGQPPETLDEPGVTGARAAAQRVPAVTTATSASPDRGHSVTVGGYREQATAEAVARRLALLGYPAYVTADAAGGGQQFSVRVGQYHDRREAEAVRDRLEREEQFRPILTP